LAVVALAVGTSAIINSGKARYAWVTIVPMVFVAATTLTAGFLNITDNYWPMTYQIGKETQGYVNTILTVVIMICAIIVLIEAFKRWFFYFKNGGAVPVHIHSSGETDADTPGATTIFRCC
jgi:carbon starvation protein